MQRSDTLPPICLSKRDHDRLKHLLTTYARTRPCRAADILRTELARAKIVEPPGIAPNIVRMHSQVRLRDEDSSRERIVTLVYPAERGSVPGALSILTSLGAALIGLSEGQSITFRGPDGRTRRVTVIEVVGHNRAFPTTPYEHGGGITDD